MTCQERLSDIARVTSINILGITVTNRRSVSEQVVTTSENVHGRWTPLKLSAPIGMNEEAQLVKAVCKGVVLDNVRGASLVGLHVCRRQEATGGIHATKSAA